MKKGFTLIELLAVIVILAIIALIVTPVISDIIASARNSANQRSVEGHIKNIEYAIVQKGFENGDGDLSKYDDIVTEPAIRATLTIPTSDPITCESYKIKNGIVLEAKGCTDSTKNWSETHDYNNGGSDSSTPEVAGTVETDEHGTTVYKGTMLASPITVFYNVTTGTKCSESDWDTNGGNNISGMSSGCLKFYAYMEDNLSYTMILDRNLGNSPVPWNSSATRYDGPVTAIASLKTYTDSWVGTIIPSNYNYFFLVDGVEKSYTINYDTDNCKARLLTTDEIARATNHTFDSYTYDTNYGYAFSSANTDNPYYWLFDRLSGCQSYGCRNSGTLPSYWTSDAIADQYSEFAWLVRYAHQLSGNESSGFVASYNGLRPVITVLKSALN